MKGRRLDNERGGAVTMDGTGLILDPLTAHVWKAVGPRGEGKAASVMPVLKRHQTCESME